MHAESMSGLGELDVDYESLRLCSATDVTVLNQVILLVEKIQFTFLELFNVYGADVFRLAEHESDSNTHAYENAPLQCAMIVRATNHVFKIKMD